MNNLNTKISARTAPTQRSLGSIISYLPEKRYGFIKGADGKSVFFHVSSVASQDRDKICDNSRVSFELVPSPKGYKALKVRLEQEAEQRWSVPDHVLTYENEVGGRFLLLVDTTTLLRYSGRDLGEIRDKLRTLARQCGANALHHYRYSRDTDHSWLNWNYIFSVHTVSAYPCFVARKDAAGSITDAQIPYDLQKRVNKMLEPPAAVWIAGLVLFAFCMVVILCLY